MPPQRSRKRDPRIPVDEAMRATIERAGRVRLGEHDRRVLDAVLIATASYSLFSDETSTRQLAGWAYGVEPAEVQPEQRRRTAKSLKKLAALDVIGYSPGAGHYSRCIVSLMPKGVADVPLDQVQGGRFRHPTGSVLCPLRLLLRVLIRRNQQCSARCTRTNALSAAAATTDAYGTRNASSPLSATACACALVLQHDRPRRLRRGLSVPVTGDTA